MADELNRLLDILRKRYPRYALQAKREGEPCATLDQLLASLRANHRAGFKCDSCREKMMLEDPFPGFPRTFSIEHFEPPSKGGFHLIENVGWTHHRCNMARADIPWQAWQRICELLKQDPILLQILVDYLFQRSIRWEAHRRQESTDSARIEDFP